MIYFFIGALFTLILVCWLDNSHSVSEIQLKDYYKMMAEREYYKAQYMLIHNVLSSLDEEDVRLINRESYNHIIVKKPDCEEFWEGCFDE